MTVDSSAKVGIQSVEESMSEKQKRPGCVRQFIIFSDILGGFYLVMALFDSAGIFHQFENQSIITLGISVAVFVAVILWINFFGALIDKQKQLPIKIILLLLAVVPATLPRLFSTIADPIDYGTYTRDMLGLLEYIAQSGLWLGVSIRVRIQYPTNAPTAETTLQNNQSALA